MGWFTYINIYLNERIEDFNEYKTSEELHEKGIVIEGFGYMAYQYNDPLKMWVSIKFGGTEEIMQLINYLENIYFAKIKRVEIESTDVNGFSSWREFSYEREASEPKNDDGHMWAVASRYYKHGEAELLSFMSDNELRIYLEDEYKNYSGENYSVEGDDLEDLIEIVVRMGNDHVSRQHGWGVLAVHKLDFKNKNIKRWE